MLNVSISPFAINVVLVALLFVAALYDLHHRPIPNWITIGGVLAGVALNSLIYHGWPGFRLSLFGLAIGLNFCLILYSLRVVGAGDVKLMAAVAALVGGPDWVGIFVITGIIGCVAGLALIAMRGRRRKTVWDIAFILSELKCGRQSYLENHAPGYSNSSLVGSSQGAMIAMGTIVFLGLNNLFS